METNPVKSLLAGKRGRSTRYCELIAAIDADLAASGRVLAGFRAFRIACPEGIALYEVLRLRYTKSEFRTFSYSERCAFRIACGFV